MADRKDVVQGTLDLLVLRIIAVQPMHGWGVMQRLRYLTEDVFQVTTGSLFPRCGGSRTADGSPVTGMSPRTTGRRAITRSRRQDRSSWPVRRNTGSRSVWPSKRCSREHETPVVSRAGHAAPVDGRGRA